MPKCDGDAIECAIANEVHKDRCAEQKRFDDLKDTNYTNLGTSLLNGQDPSHDALPTKENGAHVDLPGALDQGGWMGGGGCFQDRTITGPFGASYAISFSALCSNILAIRFGIMAVAGLVALAVVGRAISS